jgi:hypothetical protein
MALYFYHHRCSDIAISVMATPKIHKLDVASANRLGSDQVIRDLSSAVKELIENSLDAGAQSIGTCFLLFMNTRLFTHSI